MAATRRCFAKVDEGRAAVGEAGQQETAAADVAGERISDREGESDGDRRVHGVASRLEHSQSDIGRQRLLGDHHTVAGVYGLAGEQSDGQ